MCNPRLYYTAAGANDHGETLRANGRCQSFRVEGPVIGPRGDDRYKLRLCRTGEPPHYVQAQ